MKFKVELADGTKILEILEVGSLITPSTLLKLIFKISKFGSDNKMPIQAEPPEDAIIFELF